MAHSGHGPAKNCPGETTLELALKQARRYLWCIDKGPILNSLSLLHEVEYFPKETFNNKFKI